MATITKEITQKIVTDFGKEDKDTGNVRVQVALLTHKIRELTEHMKINKKDFHSRLGLTKMVSKRRRLLKYIEKTNLDGYRSLIKELGLRR
ncbi:MAG: 30S ribosomal protein S15 [Fibrobacteria bacterium]|nr:30S ribosomal protein S15 [Fibrobacteria bacterium]